MKVSSLCNAPVVRVLIFLSLLSAVAVPVSRAQVGFLMPPTYAGIGALFEADFNGDGKPDLLSSNGILQLGNGNGTFTTGMPVAGTPLAVADFNGDGKPDILEQGTGTLLVLLGNGDGTFQPPISTNSGSSLTAIVAGDLTGNGDADALGVFNSSLIVYLSNGNGTFAAGVPYTLPLAQNSSVVSVIVGDVNGDGKTDVTVITNNPLAAGQVIVFLGNGDGTLQSAKTSVGVPNAGNYFQTAVEGDFNGDGKPDLAINAGAICNGSCQGTYNISLLLGNGDGTFQAPTPVISGNGAIAAADVNGDGDLDLVVQSSSTVAQIYLGNGSGTFSNASNYILSLPGFGTLQFSTGVAIADFNLDGKLDIASGGAALLGNGNGSFQGIQLGVVPNPPDGAIVGDFDNNGTQDVALLSESQVGTTYSYNVYILSNNGGGALSLIDTYAIQEPGYGIATGDFNSDGNLDLIVFSIDPITQHWGYSVLLGKGDGSFQSPVFYPQNVAGSYSSSIIVADFNNDHKPDVAHAVGNQSLAVLLGNGDGTFAAPVYYFDGAASSLVTADFNGDGKPDIAAGGSSGTALLFGNGDGTLQPAIFPSNLSQFGVQFTADVNSDGKPDLLSGGQVALGNGNGTFTVLPPFCTGPPNCQGAYAVADFSGNGIPDLLVTQGYDHAENSAVLLGNGDGTFGPPIVLAALIPGPALIADMNGDGRSDIVFDSEDGVGVLLNSTVPAPGAKFSPSSVTFPPQTLGTNSSPTPVTLTNIGAVALTVKSVTFGGADAGEFKQTNNCSTVPPSQSCTINVTFSPTATGASSANLIVTDNAGTGSQQVAVSGTGAAVPGFTVSAAAPSPASVAAGGAATSTVTITAAGGFNQSVALSCGSITLNGSPATTAPPTCKFSPSSVTNASGTSTLTISTTGPNAALAPVSTRYRGLFYALLLPIFGVALMGAGFISRKKKLLGIVLVSLMFLGLLFLAACGGGNSGSGGGGSGGGTPAGTYTISISGAAGSTMAKPVTLMLTVQ